MIIISKHWDAAEMEQVGCVCVYVRVWGEWMGSETGGFLEEWHIKLIRFEAHFKCECSSNLNPGFVYQIVFN